MPIYVPNVGFASMTRPEKLVGIVTDPGTLEACVGDSFGRIS